MARATIDYPIDWCDLREAARASCRLIPCPVCGSDSGKAPVLTTPSVADPQRGRLVTFLRCATCSSLFTEDRVPFEYEVALSPWAQEFYLEQGAGLDTMLEPIMHLPAESNRAMLEIGCGFGFALHFARQQRGWAARGIDPSPMAAEGRRILGLDIRSGYLAEMSHLDEVYDVILASEVIEHLPLAGPVLQTVRACLGAAGVLTLTTPDAACVSPVTDLGTLIPVLSPGHHLTLYSETGLEHELRAAGFTSVKIERRGSGLIAWASQRQLFLRPPTEDDRKARDDWLATLANDPVLPPALRDGMAYRLLRTRVHAGAMASARDLFKTIAGSCRERFELDLSEPSLLSAENIRDLLGSTPRRIPFNLPGLLYCRGMIELDGDNPGEGAAWFEAAERAADGCCVFYASHGIADGETTALLRSLPRLALVALCHCDPAAVVSRFADWPEVTLEAATELTLRLLDLGHLEEASAVADRAQSAMLSVLAEGYIALIRRSDPKAAGTAFRTAERLATSPSAELVYVSHGVADGATAALLRRLRRLALLALCHSDPAAVVSRLAEWTEATLEVATELTLRLLDLGHLEEASAVAEHAQSAMLSALVDGYIALIRRNDPKVAGSAFRIAEGLATSPSPEVSERLLFGLVITAAHEDPAAAVTRLRAVPTAPERIFRSLFTRLVDLGHLAEASSLEPLGGDHTDDWEVINARAMIALNHQCDGAAAAPLFATAFSRARAAGVEGDALWRVKYHEAFAWKSVGRLEPAQAAARALLDPAPGLPPVPAGFEEQIRALELFGEAGERVC